MPPRWVARPAQGRCGRRRPAVGRDFFAKSRPVGALPALRRAGPRRLAAGPTPEPAGCSRGTGRQCAAADPARRNLRAHRMGRARPCSAATAAASDTQTDQAATGLQRRSGARRPGCLDVSRGTEAVSRRSVFVRSGRPAVLSDEGSGGARRSALVDPVRQVSRETAPVFCSLLSPADPDARTGRVFHVEPEAVSGGTAPSDSDARTGRLVEKCSDPLQRCPRRPGCSQPIRFHGRAAPVLQGRRR